MSERLMGGLTGRLPFNRPLSDVEWRDWIADSWKVPRERLAQTATLSNPMVIGMLERALAGDLKAMFWMYTTHVHLPDVRTLVRPALEKLFVVVQDIYRHAPAVLLGVIDKLALIGQHPATINHYLPLLTDRETRPCVFADVFNEQQQKKE